MSLTLLLGKANQVSDAFIQHLIAGQILAEALKKLRDPAHKKQLVTKCLQATQNQHFQVYLWSLRFALTGRLPPVPEARVHYNTNLYLLSDIAARITKQVFKVQPDAGALFKVIGRHAKQDKHVFALVEPLLGPESPLFMGLLVKQQSAYVAIAASSRSVTLAALKPKTDSKEPIPIKQIPHADFLAQVVLTQRVPFSRFYHLYQHLKLPPQANTHFIANFSVQRPPQDLLSVLDALRNPDIEPGALVKVIEENPFFCEILNRSATQLNRLNINVKSLKQSIMTHGMERIAAVLTEHVLWQRLTANQFPLAAQFKTFCVLFRSLAAQVAEHCKIGIPQQYSLAALLHVSALFTVAPLRLLHEWRYDEHQLFNAATLLTTDMQIDHIKQAQTLARAWHIDADIIHAFTPSSRRSSSTQSMLDCLQVALYLARQWLHQGDISNVRVLNELNAECKRLGVTDAIVGTLRLSHSEQMVCPLSKTIA
ncbi:HDOD domain-containing protein [Alteromonas flava]|uniref:HDOD domain-containing protein n=1 Tax=Alteromonas flava TaxID=2048003 RepID=UPI0013DB8F7B|nr:HDOD domain-containing protein [Alteromonas flava]